MSSKNVMRLCRACGELYDSTKHASLVCEPCWENPDPRLPDEFKKGGRK